MRAARLAMTAETIAMALGGALMLASEDRPCSPCAGSKRPTTPRGFLDASADPIALRELWSKCPGRLVGNRNAGAPRLPEAFRASSPVQLDPCRTREKSPLHERFRHDRHRQRSLRATCRRTVGKN